MIFGTNPRPLRKVLLFNIGLTVVLPLVVLNLLTWVLGRTGNNELSRRLLMGNLAQVQRQIDTMMEDTERQEAIVAEIVGLERMTPDRMPRVFTSLHSVFLANPQLAYIGVGDVPSGRYWMLQRNEAPPVLIRTFELDGPQTRVRDYLPGTETRPPVQIEEQEPIPYDFRTRPFAIAAMAADQPVWTPAYAFLRELGRKPTPGITYTRAIRDANQRPQTIVDIDLEIASLANFLKSLHEDQAGITMILEESSERRRLIAHPNLAIVLDTPRNDLHNSLDTIRDPLTRQAIQLATSDGHIHELRHEAVDYFLLTTTVQKPNRPTWRIVTVMPQSAAVGAVPQLQRISFWISVVVVLATITVGFRSADWVTKPITQLEDRVMRLAGGKYSNSDVETGPLEVVNLAGAFQYLANQVAYRERELIVSNAQLATEIAERVIVEDELRKSELKTRQLYEHTSDCITLVRLDPDGVFRCEGINRAAEVATGRSTAESLNRTPGELFPAEAADAMIARYHATLRAAHPLIFDYLMPMSDGPRWFQTLFVPLPTLEGDRPRVAAFGRDVTQARESKRKLELSEQKFQRAFMASPFPLSISRLDTSEFIEVNSAFCEYVGWSREEMIGKPATTLNIWVRLEDREAIVRQMTNDRSVRFFEMQVRRKDGEIRVGLMSADVLEIEGVGLVAIGSIMDITERQKAQAALQASEEKFKALFRFSPVSMVLSRAEDGKIVDVNHGFEVLTGFSRDEVVESTSTEVGLLTTDERDHYHHILRNNGGRISGLEMIRTRRDGTARVHMTEVERVSIGGVEHYILCSTDITDRRNMEASLRLANATLEQRVHERTEELAATNRELEAFCYSVSHDLRAPLRAIDGFSQALIEDYATVIDTTGQDYMRRIRVASKRMGELIDDLLNLSRVTRLDMKRDHVDLAPIARSIVDALRNTQPDRIVNVEIPESVPCYGDANLLKIALENLLSNAWKYSSKTENAQIVLESSCENGWYHYCVKDNGAGFDMTYAHKLFQPFQRLHRPDEFEGHGVGLATVQRIIRRHGGQVWATGSPDAGAEFWFTLPPAPGSVA